MSAPKNDSPAEQAAREVSEPLLREAAAIMDALMQKSDCSQERNAEFAAVSAWKIKAKGGTPFFQPLEALATREASAQPNPWRQAVDDAKVAAGLDCLGPDEIPSEALADLIGHEVAMALDPAVSAAAQALIERGNSGGSAPDSGDSVDDSGGSSAQVADVMADARRYRWLRDKADYRRAPEGSPQVCLTDEFGCIVSLMPSAYPRGEALDAAIDAELDREGPKT